MSLSPSHLSDDQPVVDVDKISWLTFLPSAKEQASLAEETTVLVC